MHVRNQSLGIYTGLHIYSIVLEALGFTGKSTSSPVGTDTDGLGSQGWLKQGGDPGAELSGGDPGAELSGELSHLRLLEVGEMSHLMVAKQGGWWASGGTDGLWCPGVAEARWF